MFAEGAWFARFDGLIMKVAQPVPVAEELIEQMPGGFDAMNDFVRETICRALEASNQHYEQTFKGLEYQAAVTLWSTTSGRLVEPMLDNGEHE
eukprot:Skav229699  [mRNA]  locus=scaffold3722:269180:269458:- [translate_table: standard]